MPHFFTLAALIFAFAGYRSSSTRRRLLSLAAAGLAAIVSTLIASGTYWFFHLPYARGDLFGW